MLDHDDPMLCPDRHSEVEQAMHVAAVKAMVATARGLSLSEIEDRFPAPSVLDPHAGTSHVMVRRELLVDIWQHLWDHGRTAADEALGKRVAEVIAP